MLPQEITRMRLDRGEKQGLFWGRIFCTQSGGCRRENGVQMSEGDQFLFNLVYVWDNEEAIRQIEYRRGMK